MKKRALKIYFAGELFDAKDLAGNLLFAQAVERFSEGRYKVMLPQEGECETVDRSVESIRDADFELLFECDLIVANFDGTDPDSGTVAEFCYAKMIDMPAVLLRTDFRSGGDETLPDNVPWNLMCVSYPRTKVLCLNAMEHYHRSLAASTETSQVLETFFKSLALPLVAALDEVVQQPSWLKSDEVASQLERTLRSIGGTMGKRFPQERTVSLAGSKIESGLFM